MSGRIIKSMLLTDSYHLSMAQGYLDHGMTREAVFEFFVRKLPRDRNFLISAGLEQILEFLETLRFTADDLAWLKSQKIYSDRLLSWCESIRFNGTVWAVSEGIPFFPMEPILRIEAPLPLAQIVETRIIQLLHLETVVASKAARCRIAAKNHPLIDFGLRRAHGAEAGLLAARACYLAGFEGSSIPLAERDFGIPCFGTMAHSFIEAHDDERDALIRFAESNPSNAYFLIDTYDTERAAAKVVKLAPILASRGIEVRGVRIDSGDLADHSRKVRRILDQAGLRHLRILASGGLDEYAIQDLLARGAPIDSFATGTHVVTSEDAPYLDCAYKIQEYDGVPRRKISEGKATLPGRKQVYRVHSKEGIPLRDTVCRDSETEEGTALLVPVMKEGKRLESATPLATIRSRCLAELERLPERSRSLRNQEVYEVKISSGLEKLMS